MVTSVLDSDYYRISKSISTEVGSKNLYTSDNINEISKLIYPTKTPFKLMRPATINYRAVKSNSYYLDISRSKVGNWKKLSTRHPNFVLIDSFSSLSNVNYALYRVY